MDSVTTLPPAVRPKVGGRLASVEPSWRRALAGAIRDPAELCELLELPVEMAKPQAAGGFPLLVPREFVARMKPGDPRDPLLMQVLPTAAELESTPGFSADPVGDGAAEVLPGLLHKYAGRVLLITTGGVRGALPLLFSAPLSVRSGAERAGGVGASDRPHCRGRVDSRSDP